MSMRPITSGPKHHWFGYYDKLQFDPSGRYVLGMEVDFEHRSPTSEDVIRVGMIDLADGDRWIELGETRAWCWQQGCMLQWIPGSDREVIWNDREGDRFVCHVLDVHSGKKRTLGSPIYTVSPNGRTAISADFRRINHMRPGYGYAGLPDPNRELLAPDDAGIYSVDLETGAATFLISIAQVAAIPDPHRDLSEAKHYFNHLLFNTDGSRFIFLHRCRWGESGLHTRMMTAAADGSDIYGVGQYGYTSHFIWRDPEHILAWARHPSHEDAFYVFQDGTQEVEVIGKGVMKVDGHCTYLADTNWILIDTYPVPRGDGKVQELYLYNVESGQRHELGEFGAAPEYAGEWRCDLHPRSSPDGSLITIDSAHGGNGRQIHLMDISAQQAS